MADSVKPLRLRREIAPRPTPTEASEGPIARVLVDSGLLHIDQEFDFLVPAEMSESISIGVLVKVPFNRKQVLGIVTGRFETSTFRGEIRFISELVRPFPVITQNVLKLATEVKRYYGGTRWDVLRFALPTFSKKAKIEKQFVGENDLAQAIESKVDARYPKGFWDALHGDPHIRPIRAFWAPPPAEDPFNFLVSLVTHASGSALIILPDYSDVMRFAQTLKNLTNIDERSILVWHSEMTRAERQEIFLQVLQNQPIVLIGVRGALFLPISNLKLLILWDEGSSNYSEQRAPYFHAREVAIMKAHIESAHLICAAPSPSVQAVAYLERKYFALLQAERETSKFRVQAIEERNAPQELGRIPTKAWQTIRNGLQLGPVLVQVPMRGYIQSITCSNCRNQAICSCGGKILWRNRQPNPECALCGSIFHSWRCSYCSGHQVRHQQIGDERIMEELGKAFPLFPIISSNAEHLVGGVSNSPSIVIATPGAEPRAENGYSAVVVLNSSMMLNRATISAEEESRRRWFELVTLLQPGASIFIDADYRNRNIQSLVRWDALGAGIRDLHERRALALPPITKTLLISGESADLPEIVRNLSPHVAISRPKAINREESSIVIRIMTNDSNTIVEEIFQRARNRSAKGLSAMRVKVDPIDPDSA